jgi:hypothetical protein
VNVRVDETALLNFLVGNISGNYVNIGEILAAGAAYERGDNVPILRLGAENTSVLVGDSGDPSFFSAGAFYALGCIDSDQAFDWSDPVSKRKAQYEEAVEHLPAGFFAPFSKTAATGLLFSHLGNSA